MITTNTGAKKLESSDNWREIFPNPGTSAAGAHNASVDAADRIQPEIAPIINGKQCALGAASGDYVLLRNSTIAGKSDGAYQATKAIPANTDLDSTYLGSAITGGMVNELNNNITTLRTTSEVAYSVNTSYVDGVQSYFKIYKRNNVLIARGYIHTHTQIPANGTWFIKLTNDTFANTGTSLFYFGVATKGGNTSYTIRASGDTMTSDVAAIPTGDIAIILTAFVS